jgi:hypothetical protein
VGKLHSCLCNPGYLCLQLADWGSPQTGLPAGTELISSCMKMRSRRRAVGPVTVALQPYFSYCYTKLNSREVERNVTKDVDANPYRVPLK